MERIQEMIFALKEFIIQMAHKDNTLNNLNNERQLCRGCGYSSAVECLTCKSPGFDLQHFNKTKLAGQTGPYAIF